MHDDGMGLLPLSACWVDPTQNPYFLGVLQQRILNFRQRSFTCWQSQCNREHDLDGWPRFSMSVNEAARLNDTPVSSLPSDVDAADMAAFVPFGPRAHRTTPASSWHTNSTHRQVRLASSCVSWDLGNYTAPWGAG